MTGFDWSAAITVIAIFVYVAGAMALIMSGISGFIDSKPRGRTKMAIGISLIVLGVACMFGFTPR